MAHRLVIIGGGPGGNAAATWAARLGADVTMIEGNHWETENEYNIMIYFRETGSLFDRLLNFTTLNSKNR